MLFEEVQIKADELQNARNDLLDENLQLNKVCDEKLKAIKRINKPKGNIWDRSMDMSSSINVKLNMIILFEKKNLLEIKP
jgi:hypothetical protein